MSHILPHPGEAVLWGQACCLLAWAARFGQVLICINPLT